MCVDQGEPSNPDAVGAFGGINASGADGSVLGGGHGADKACGDDDDDDNTCSIIAQAALGGNHENPLAGQLWWQRW